MSVDLSERIRRANPLPNGDGTPADEGVLASILATSPEPKDRRRTIRSRRSVLLVAAAIIGVALLAAAGTTFAPDYFGPSNSEPTPAMLIAGLRTLAEAGGAVGDFDEGELVRLAAFDGPEGHVSIYVAPLRSGSGFCVIDALNESLSGGSCTGVGSKGWSAAGSSDWGDVRVLLGRLDGASEGVEIHFEDGSVRMASIRAPWWVYVVGGEETEPGHRPISFTSVDETGAPVRDVDLSILW